jgi:Holliday junction resolvase-like predicted endonuclease
MHFKLNGLAYDLTPAEVEHRVAGAIPEPVRQHAVRLGGEWYPVKQAFELAIGVPRSEFTSHIARRHLAALGMEMAGVVESRPRTTSRQTDSLEGARAAKLGRELLSEIGHKDDERWHSEAEVQAAVVAHLATQGWKVLSVADTATRQHGIDVVATDVNGRGAGIEVKGYPSRTYADPRRAGETKRTQPSTQAGHWYAQAILAAMRLRTKRPELRSVIALPDFSRYRDLYVETKSSLHTAGIEVWWVTNEGLVSDER